MVTWHTTTQPGPDHLNPLTLIHKQAQAIILHATAVATMTPVNFAVLRSFHPNNAKLSLASHPPQQDIRTIVLHFELRMLLMRYLEAYN